MVSDGFPQLDGRLLVVFDGHCVLCNGAVRWFLRHDRLDRLRFAASDSAKVSSLIARHQTGFKDSNAAPSTILALRHVGGTREEVLIRSDAVLSMLRELPPPWPAIAAALRLIPRPVRDLAYRLIARGRTHIRGRLDTCPLPTAEERERFL